MPYFLVVERFADVLRQQQQERERREQERIQMLKADPFDPETQRRIAEEIRMENVNQNMETAIEYAPESFGQVHMLYVDCLVNGQDVKAFVNSGNFTVCSRSMAAMQYPCLCKGELRMCLTSDFDEAMLRTHLFTSAHVGMRVRI